MNNRKKIRLPFEDSHKQCTNCNACGQVCPKSCINCRNGEMQFIDEGCINCNRCANVCPVINLSLRIFRYPREAYAAWSIDKEDRATSTSGGAASVFYKRALEMGYYIVGATYNKELQVELYVTNEYEIIQEFKQSKYVFSRTGDCYKQIKGLLNREIPVLFIGLPCQVAGLLQFLGTQYRNLVTVDIICHGTPNPEVLKEYIDFRDVNRKASKLHFRNDNEFYFELTDCSGNTVYKKRGRTDEYLAAFLEGIDYQEQCYSCSYARPERISDLTIGDFWGLGDEKPFHHPYTGAISVILVNSDIGQAFLDKCKKDFFLEKREVPEAINGNSQLRHPTPIHPKHNRFLDLLEAGVPFAEAVNSVLHEEMIQEEKELQRRDLRALGSKLKKAILRRK